ncbi:hypothetical protein NW759_016780 [Fusarium solani]|nr:hypothetical protein NW759_016780 [Fusarium solani]
MCSPIITTAKVSANTKTFAAEAPVEMANPVCICTECECRNIVTFPGGNLCEYCNYNHNN